MTTKSRSPQEQAYILKAIAFILKAKEEDAYAVYSIGNALTHDSGYHNPLFFVAKREEIYYSALYKAMHKPLQWYIIGGEIELNRILNISDAKLIPIDDGLYRLKYY